MITSVLLFCEARCSSLLHGYPHRTGRRRLALWGKGKEEQGADLPTRGAILIALHFTPPGSA